MVAVTGAEPLFMAVKEVISPLPDAGRPIEVLLFVQVYVVVPPELVVEKLTAAVLLPLQTTWLAGMLTCAVGLTVMVNTWDDPLQFTLALLKRGVTVMVAVTGDEPLFIAVKEVILPLPDAGRPIEVLLFVQVYVVVPPELVVEKLTAAVLLPLQTTWLAGMFTCAVGLTVMVNTWDDPLQFTLALLKRGVTVMVAVTGAEPLFMAVKEVISPLPDAGRPIEVLSFVQVYVVVPPELMVEKLTAAVLLPLQTTWLAGMLTWAEGFTVMVNTWDDPLQSKLALLYRGVTVIVAVTGAEPLFMAVKEVISPLPDAGRPIVELSFVQVYVVVPPELMVEKLTAEVLLPLQTTWLAGMLTCAVGLTVMVNTWDDPLQSKLALLYRGVTVMVAVTGAEPLFMAVKEVISPLPDAGRPIVELSFVQVYVVVPPELMVEKLTAEVLLPLQTTWLAGMFTCAVGLTVMVNTWDDPLQSKLALLYRGVTVMVAVTGTEPLFMAVKEVISPLPDAGRPIVELSFVQVYVVVPPELMVEKLTAAVLLPLQTTWLAGMFTWAEGLTVTLTVSTIPWQPLTPGVII